MNIFQTVKENVTARQAAEQYGLKINRNGMICCPFHDDRHPSMKVDKEYSQEWFEDGQIDEVAFCENFLQRMPLKCINGIFFSYDGILPDSEVEKEIYRMVKPVLTKGISKKVKQLLEVLKLEAYSEELPVQMDRIHVNNGTYFLSGNFTEMKEFCLNRLPVNYEMKEAKPERWLKSE